MQTKVIKYRWSAILDDRVCELCRSLDGMVVDAVSPEYELWQPGLHPNCRCHYVPVLESDVRIPPTTWKTPAMDLITKYAVLIPFVFLFRKPAEIPEYAVSMPEEEKIKFFKKKVKTKTKPVIVFLDKNFSFIFDKEIEDKLVFSAYEEALLGYAKYYIRSEIPDKDLQDYIDRELENRGLERY